VSQAPTKIRPLMSVNDVCKFLGFSRSTVYKLVREDRIPELKVKAGRRTFKRFRYEDILEFSEQNTEEIFDDN